MKGAAERADEDGGAQAQAGGEQGGAKHGGNPHARGASPRHSFQRRVATGEVRLGGGRESDTRCVGRAGFLKVLYGDGGGEREMY